MAVETFERLSPQANMEELVRIAFSKGIVVLSPVIVTSADEKIALLVDQQTTSEIDKAETTPSFPAITLPTVPITDLRLVREYSFANQVARGLQEFFVGKRSVEIPDKAVQPVGIRLLRGAQDERALVIPYTASLLYKSYQARVQPASEVSGRLSWTPLNLAKEQIRMLARNTEDPALCDTKTYLEHQA